MDKYTIGYTGHLPKAEAQIERSYPRIARSVELGQLRPPPEDTVVEFASPKYRQAKKHVMTDYKLPGYTGFVPQNNFQFEKRFSTSVLDAAEMAADLADKAKHTTNVEN
eukprot:TRINITY_DN823_c0_g1_i1.p1 TRINITY_DN823_c0_g1~~TRINITY_DN823_c0_g1_i1.p1  ORF type:complete len:109 (+),score=22.27 TRINITY_DN823_c0_g1_i1:290-616(+)